MGVPAGDYRQSKSGRTGRFGRLPASAIGSTPKNAKPGTPPISNAGTRPSRLMMGSHGSDAFTTWITSERGLEAAFACVVGRERHKKIPEQAQQRTRSRCDQLMSGR